MSSERHEGAAGPAAPWWKRALLAGLSGAWALAVAAGLTILWSYSAGPAPSGHAPVRWPASTRLHRSPGRPTLVMAAHPHCPCTRASLGELNALMARTEGKLDALVLFERPAGVPERWERSDLWDSAAAIPGVRAVRDDDGAEAGRFGALASGQTMVYGADGALLFSGGITGARGHQGDNAGRSAIVALVSGQVPVRTRTPVFGCALGGAASLERLEGDRNDPGGPLSQGKRLLAAFQ